MLFGAVIQLTSYAYVRKLLPVYFLLSGGTQQMMQGVQVKLNTELPWEKQHSTTRRLFSPANWT
jgi:hypothetical protein